MESNVEIRRKDGRLDGFLCQHAFIILATTEGTPLGTGSRSPSTTCERKEETKKEGRKGK